MSVLRRAEEMCCCWCAGEEVVLEYHHPEALPPESAFVVRVASILQVSPLKC